MTAADLAALGFVEAGTCALDTGLKSGLRIAIERHKKDRVIYAFLVDDEVKYIGVCDATKTCFSDRMSRYQAITGAGTNERIVGNLRRALAAGAAVRILAWHPKEDIRVGALQVDLVMGLEKPLIDLVKPEWNKQR